MATAGNVCIFCCACTIAEKRRILSPANDSNADVYEFLTTVVGYQFGAEVVYACRYPCFAEARKAAKCYGELSCLIRKLKPKVSPNALLRTTREASTQTSPQPSVDLPAPILSGDSAPLSTPVYCSTWSSSESKETNSCTSGSEDLGGNINLRADPEPSSLSAIGADPGPSPLCVANYERRKCTALGQSTKKKHPRRLSRKKKHLVATPLTLKRARQPSYQPRKRAKLTTPPSTIRVMHMKGRKLVHSFRIGTPFKHMVKTTRFRKPQYTARTLLKAPQLKDATIGEITLVVQNECKTLCSHSPSRSFFHTMPIEGLKDFGDWSIAMQDLKSRAPVLTAVLEATAKSSMNVLPPAPMICMAVAILLKARSQRMCRLQILISCLLYAGHASKRVYNRLSKLGISVTHSTVVQVVQKLGEKHDQVVRDWRAALECGSADSNGTVAPSRSFVLVGDNIDKRVTPREMRVGSQVQSLHYFHSYAALNRIDTSHLDDTKPLGSLRDLPLSTFLPTTTDCTKIRENYVVLMARILVKYIPHLSHLHKCVPQHIRHQYSAALAQKSITVPVGVIPKNENVREQMVQILEELQGNYTPTHLSENGEETIHKVVFFGDQLTAERARKSQEARVNSETKKDALFGLQPAISDWHAEANFLQTVFTRLYKPGSSIQGGTLLQLRNLINRRNVSAQTSGKFNEALDFLELVITGHVLAAAMHFFGMKSISDSPSSNALPSVPRDEQWPLLKCAVGKIIDRYVVVSANVTEAEHLVVCVEDLNPHVCRISSEHSYAHSSQLECHQRRLPQWLQTFQDEPAPSRSVRSQVADGVFNYASAVLNDGLLLFELRDAIHEGDGERVLRCWKFMLLYWRCGGHTKYTLETIHLLGAVHATCTARVAHELTWCRFINRRGGAGNNLPVDLYMEHLNRTLKDYLHGLGANISETSIVKTSRSLQHLLKLSLEFDAVCNIAPDSLHHTRRSFGKDMELVLNELVKESKVFDYIPGRFHASFKTIKPHIASHIDITKFTKWIQQQVSKLSNTVELSKVMHP